MRLAKLRSLLFWTVAILLAGSVAGCVNPFDPLSKSDEIQGFTYFDFTASQDHWDSDPEWDGLQITLTYYNEFGETLNFHDKPHEITVEFWSSKAGETEGTTVRDSLLISKTVDFSNSDDLIRIPIEYYVDSLVVPISDDDTGTTKFTTGYAESITGYLLIRIFPPLEKPQKELVFVQADIEFYTPEDAPATLTE